MPSGTYGRTGFHPAPKFNFRVAWADNSKGPASLTAANYASGADAALDSWVILKKANKD